VIIPAAVTTFENTVAAFFDWEVFETFEKDEDEDINAKLLEIIILLQLHRKEQTGSVAWNILMNSLNEEISVHLCAKMKLVSLHQRTSKHSYRQ